VLVDRNHLALPAVQADPLQDPSAKTASDDDRVRIGAALDVEAVRATLREVLVQRLLAVVV